MDLKIKTKDYYTLQALTDSASSVRIAFLILSLKLDKDSSLYMFCKDASGWMEDWLTIQ